MSSVFLTRSETNWTIQPKKMVRGLKFWILVVELYALSIERNCADKLRSYVLYPALFICLNISSLNLY